jgi:hypothetical protein
MTSDFVSLPSSVDKPSSATVSVWVNQIAPGTSASTIAYHRADPGAVLGWSFEPAQVDGGNVTFRAGNATTGMSSSVSAAGFALSTWTHLVATYDQVSGLLDLYIDGDLAASTLVTNFSGIGHLASTMHLGEGLAGYLDEFSVWNSALDQVQIAQLYDYGRQRKALRSQFSTPVSPCARELARNPSAADGTYTFTLGADTDAVPVFCDMTGGGWTMIFKKSAGNSGGVEQLWFGGALNESDVTMLSRTKKVGKDYVSRMVLMPKYFAEERVEVATDLGGVQKNIVFDMIEAGANDFFSPARVKSSSWNDLPTQANWDSSLTGRYFSVFGYGTRDFYISNNWGGCGSDQGWLMATSLNSCFYESNTLRILYATGPGKQLAGSMGQADTLMVFGR